MVALWSFLLDQLDVERSILRFPRPLHASEGALRILAKGNWKLKVFWWGGRFGRSLLCPGRAQKKPVAVVHLTGAYLSTETNLVPIRGVMKKEFDTGHTHTHGMKIAPLGLAGGRSYDRTISLRTPTMKESQRLREKTTSSVFVSTCSNAVHAQFHWLAYTRNTRPCACDVVCL